MRRIQIITLGLFLISSVTALPVLADDASSFSVQQYGMSLDQIKQAATQGDPDAEYALGYMYYYGKGITRDEQAAKLWIQRAATQGQPEAIKAQQLLGLGNSSSTAQNQASNAVANATNTNAATNNQAVTADNSSAANITTANQANNNATAAAPASNNQIDASVLQPSSSSKAVASQAATTKPKLATAKQAQKKEVATAAAGSVSAARLLKEPGHYYTIQLLGAHHQNEATQFIAANQLGSKATFYKTSFQGKPWFVVVYGIYQNQEEASAALKQLPMTAQKAGPWVKALASVQESIRNGGTALE